MSVNLKCEREYFVCLVNFSQLLIIFPAKHNAGEIKKLMQEKAFQYYWPVVSPFP